MSDPTITVPYKVLAKGYQISGDVRSGYKATVPYLLAWSDAFSFADQIFGRASSYTVGPITWTTPHRFPPAAANMYAQRFSIEPCGAGGQPISQLKGLGPGEFYTHAIVKVDYETPNYTQQQSDDKNNLQQLDPKNPITMCEQAVKLQSKMETRKGGSYVFADGSPVKGDMGVLIPECKLVLTFPRVPYLPWGLIQPFVGTLNDEDMLGCLRGTLLLEGMNTKIVQSQGGIGQQVQLDYAYTVLGDWNYVPKADGTLALVHQKGGSDVDANRIYKYKDHRLIFQDLIYV